MLSSVGVNLSARQDNLSMAPDEPLVALPVIDKQGIITTRSSAMDNQLIVYR